MYGLVFVLVVCRASLCPGLDQPMALEVATGCSTHPCKGFQGKIPCVCVSASVLWVGASPVLVGEVMYDLSRCVYGLQSERQGGCCRLCV